VLFCNEREARGLAGDSGGDLVDVGRELHSRLPAGDDPRFPAVVLKLGGDGAIVLTPSGDVTAAAAAVEVVDTVGAGDTLAGTVLAALMSGSDWAEALPLGVAAATFSTTGPGGTSVRPEPAEVGAAARALRVRDGRRPAPEA
jgi:sugar/nucleoside kinase (ribokinase family)